jgi:hypothetical protein
LDNSGTCPADDGVIVQTNTGNCYFRQFSGPVHLSWYGVPDASSCWSSASGFPLSCDATALVKKALAAAAVGQNFGGDGGVTTDGRSIAILTQCDACADGVGIDIPSDQYLTCEGPPGGGRGLNSSTPYWTLPHSIVLHPGLTVLREGNSRSSSCIERPDWLYERSSTDLTIPPTTVHQTVQMMHQFTGTATTCTAKTCNMDNMLIIGFDVCDNTSQSAKTVLKDLLEECNVDEWQHDNGGGMKLQNIMVKQYLEGNLDDGVKEEVWTITNVQQSGTDGVKVTFGIGGSGDHPFAGDIVLIAGLGQGGSVAPVSADGRWLVDSVTTSGGTATVVLTGASWAGPADSAASWKGGAPAITVTDTTNIIPGQYVCGSGTPPFCAPPSGFTLGTVTLAAMIGPHDTGSILVSGSFQGWPVSGLAKIESEYVSYTLLDATHLNIIARGLHGTSNVSHSSSTAVTGAAPVVVGVVPSSEAVLVSAQAQSASSGSVTFANDTLVVTGGTLGSLTLNPSYHTWTATTGAESPPSGTLNVIASGSGTAITPTKNCFKIQPNMAAYDVTGMTDLGTVQTVDCTVTNTITVSGSSTFSNHVVRFSGCGYPGFGTSSAMPWLGNCASTSLLIGGSSDENEANETQGIVCEYVHLFGNQIQIHTINGPAMNCTDFIIAGGGGKGDQLDPDSIAFWLEGRVTKTQFSNGRIAGAVTSILDTPAAGAQQDGMGISNVQVPGNILLGADANIVLDGIHGFPTASQYVFAPGAIASAHVTGNILPAWPVYFDDPAVFAKLYCAGNAFATALCSQVKSTPTCLTALTVCMGTDARFDIAVTGPPTATTFSVLLAGHYASTPICSATASPTTTGTVTSVSISGVSVQSWGTTVTFKTSNAVPHVYGSCHGATG